MTTKLKKYPCPQCNSMYWIPIVYGYPNQNLLEESSRGEVALLGDAVLRMKARIGKQEMRTPDL